MRIFSQTPTFIIEPNFIDCIQKGIKPDVSVYDGTKSTQIALATKRAHAKGGILKIEY